MKALRSLALAGLCLLGLPQLGIAQPPPKDVDIAISPTPLLRYYRIPSTVQLGLAISNKGQQTVNSFKIYASVNEGDTVETPISINGGMPYNSQLRNLIRVNGVPNIMAEGTYALKVWIGDIVTVNNPTQGVDDMEPRNSTIEWTMVGVDARSASNKKVLIEEFTGAWCQWCPSGFDIIENMLEKMPDKFVPVMIHNRDGMSFPDGDTFTQLSGVTSFPSGQVDRMTFGAGLSAGNVSIFEPFTRLMLDAYNPVEFKMTSSYEASTRRAQINLEAEFMIDIAGDIRFNAYVVEDKLTGSGPLWDQKNALSGNPAYRDSRYFSKPPTIVGHEHNHVLRQFLGGILGEKGTLTDSVVKKGTKYTHTFTFNLDTRFKADNVYFVGFVARNSDKLPEREVYNCDGFYTKGWNVSVPDRKNLTIGEVSVFPNPARLETNVQFELKTSQPVSIRLMDIMGREIRSEELGQQPAGTGMHSLQIGDLTPGQYLVSITAGGHTHLEKLIVQ